MGIKAIGFDIDGTLYPESRFYWATWPSFLTHPRLVYGFARARKMVRTPESLESAAGRPYPRRQAEIIGGILGLSAEKAAYLVEKHLYSTWDRRFRSVDPFPGVRDVLEALHSRGYRLAALSDFPVRGKLKSLGLSGLWDVVLSSEDTSCLKPHEAPFLEMLKRLELQPHEVIYVGNSYEKDVLGAAAAGIPPAYFDPSGKTAGSLSPSGGFAFRSYHEFIPRLDAWLTDSLS